MSAAYVSSSQIKKFRECKRSWGFTYILGMRAPDTAATRLGKQIDDEQLQPYFKDGKPLDLSCDAGLIAKTVLPLCPERAPDLQVQRYFEFPTPTMGSDGKPLFRYRGYMDLWVPDASRVPGYVAFDKAIPSVIDFKSTKNFTYAKTETSLATDEQAIIYALSAMHSAKVRTVDLNWLYMLTKGPIDADKPHKPRRVHLRVTADHVAEQFTAINETALEMHALRNTVSDPLTLPPTISACENYGGCPFRSQCNFSPIDLIEARAAEYAQAVEIIEMSNAPLSLLDSLRARQVSAAPAADEPPAAPATSATPAPPTPPLVAVAPVAEPLGINPPESTLPPASPVGGKRKRAAPAAKIADAAAYEVVSDVGTAQEVDIVAAKEELRKAFSDYPNEDQPYLTLEFVEGDGTKINVSGHALKGESVREAIQRLKGAA